MNPARVHLSIFAASGIFPPGTPHRRRNVRHRLLVARNQFCTVAFTAHFERSGAQFSCLSSISRPQRGVTRTWRITSGEIQDVGRAQGRNFRMENLFQKLMLGGSTAALFAAMPVTAFAQGSSDIEQVVVSASRIQIAGYQQPTPVSVIGATALLEAANADIGDTLRQMPSMGNSATPEKGSSGNASNSTALGISGVNLRNLGSARTLVLFDGQRVVGSALTRGVDLSIIPSSIVQRVDVVTEGASAAWGSDAISGVINIDRQQELQRPEGLASTSRTPGRTPAAAMASRSTNGFDLLAAAAISNGRSPTMTARRQCSRTPPTGSPIRPWSATRFMWRAITLCRSW